ncbi:MAG TPA: hypothetical protein VF158_02345 [Longimicrobiales bacterium]
MIRSRTLVSGLGLAAIVGLAACGEPSAFEVEEEFEPSFSVADEASGLVVCPVGETRSASAIIGRRGGTVELDGHRVTLPRGAVDRPTMITLTAPASQYLEIDLTANGQEHFEFNVPVTVTISYARCHQRHLRRELLDAWEIDPDTKAMVESMPSRDKKGRQAVVFKTRHFSTFAIAD